MSTESNTCFGMVISGMGRGVSGSRGAGGCSLRSQNVSGLYTSVKVNSISDGILWNFMRQNGTNVYYTKMKVPIKN